jgi:hypothetical protein
MVKNAIQISYIAFNGGNTYMAGFAGKGDLVYWVNCTEKDFANTYNRTAFPDQGVLFYGISGMALQNGNVLLSGSFSFTDEPGPRLPVQDSTQGVYETVWSNGSLQVLAHSQYWEAEVNYPQTAGIAVQGSDVYVAGTTPDSAKLGGYWLNGVFNAINSGKFIPTSAYASGADAYITGYTYTSPGNYSAVYWKNGVLYSLNGGITANAVTVYGQDFYVLGVDGGNNTAVWKNGALYQVLGPAQNMVASCIGVANY